MAPKIYTRKGDDGTTIDVVFKTDGYFIRVKDRVVLTSTFPTTNTVVKSILAPFPGVTQAQVKCVGGKVLPRVDTGRMVTGDRFKQRRHVENLYKRLPSLPGPFPPGLSPRRAVFPSER